MNLKARFDSVSIWLLGCIGLVMIMVLVGGITRLTHSGLSMVDWHPIYGILPPITEGQWQAAFEQYQRYPQFQLRFPDMIVPEFKRIFFWEFLHRILGRVLGLFALLPFAWAWLRGRLSTSQRQHGSAINLLIIGQGVLGWYMVMSGLVDRPEVSHYRLAAHLSLAFFLFAYLLALLLRRWRQPMAPDEPMDLQPGKIGLWVLLGLVSLQIIYGALTAGLKAGYVYNTWPKMGEDWLPDMAFAMRPFWVNFVENVFMVQFLHRSLALLIVAAALLLFIRQVRAGVAGIYKRRYLLLYGGILLQVILGISTLVLRIPVGLAVAHQLGALLVLGSIVGILALEV